MNYLLDTHVFWWAATAPERLSARVREALLGPDNKVIVSVVVWWELILKRSRGGIDFPDPHVFLPTTARRLGAGDILPVTALHTLALDRLPAIHRDPFDRMLVAQATVEKLVLISSDDEVRQYGVEVLW